MDNNIHQQSTTTLFTVWCHIFATLGHLMPSFGVYKLCSEQRIFYSKFKRRFVRFFNSSSRSFYHSGRLVHNSFEECTKNGSIQFQYILPVCQRAKTILLILFLLEVFWYSQNVTRERFKRNKWGEENKINGRKKELRKSHGWTQSVSTTKGT